MAGLEWLNKWADPGPYPFRTEGFFVSCVAHIDDTVYAIAKYKKIGKKGFETIYDTFIDIYDVSKADTGELDFEIVSRLRGSLPVKSMVFLKTTNMLVTTSDEKNILFYNLSNLSIDPEKPNPPSGKLATLGTPLYKIIPLDKTLYYMEKEANCREHTCPSGHALVLVGLEQQNPLKAGYRTKIILPSERPHAISTSFAFVDKGDETTLFVALDDGNLYCLVSTPEKPNSLEKVNIPLSPKQANITDMTVIEDGRLVVIYSSGHIFISSTPEKDTFVLLYGSITDAIDGNNKLLSLPGNTVAASFKRNRFPSPFPSNEQITTDPGLINEISCGLYMKLEENGPPIGPRIWYGQQHQIVGLSIIPPGILQGDVSWMSASIDGYYMLHMYREPRAPLPPIRGAPRPPPPPPLKEPYENDFEPETPRPKGVNTAIGTNAPPPGISIGTNAPPPGISVGTNAPPPGINASVGNNINVSLKDVQILHDDKSTPYEVTDRRGKGNEGYLIKRAHAMKNDEIAYVVPTVEDDRRGMKLQYQLEGSEEWIDTPSGAQIPFPLAEGDNIMELRVMFIANNMANLNAKLESELGLAKSGTSTNSPVVRSYTIQILKEQDVYLEHLRLFSEAKTQIPMKFDRNTLEYSVRVAQTVKFVAVRPRVPAGKKFEVTYSVGNDEWKQVQQTTGGDPIFKALLNNGINEVKVKVKGPLGKEVIYIVRITREETGWWVPADKGLPTFLKTNTNVSRRRNIVREMRLANQTQRRINANKAAAEAAALAATEASRIQRLRNARSGKLVTPPSSRPQTPRPVTPLPPLPSTPVNEERLAALRAAQAERSRAALASASSQRRPSVVSRPPSPARSFFSGRPRSGSPRPLPGWRKGGSRKKKGTRFRKTRNKRR